MLFAYYISTWLVSNYNVDGNLLDLDYKILTDGLYYFNIWKEQLKARTIKISPLEQQGAGHLNEFTHRENKALFNFISDQTDKASIVYTLIS